MSAPIEITLLAKAGGPLTKRISLAADGSLKSDGSACLMGWGGARRARFSDLYTFADCIGNLAQHEAVALGSLRLNLPGKVDITTKDKLAELNGAARPSLIARTGDHRLSCRPTRPRTYWISTPRACRCTWRPGSTSGGAIGPRWCPCCRSWRPRRG